MPEDDGTDHLNLDVEPKHTCKQCEKIFKNKEEVVHHIEEENKIKCNLFGHSNFLLGLVVFIGART